MRVGFSGSQGTGKTTLAKAMVRDPRFKDWKFVPSTARIAVEQGFKVNREADPLSQLLTTCSRITAEYRVTGDATSTVSDRTPLDSLAYTTYQYNEVWTDFNSKFYWDVSYDLVEKAMKEYDAIFYFPPYWVPKEDGVRSGDRQYQLDIDELVVTFFDSMGVSALSVPEGTNAERVDFIAKYI